MAAFETVANHCATKATANMVAVLIDMGIITFGSGQSGTSTPLQNVVFPLSNNRKQARSKSGDSSDDFLHESPFSSPINSSSSSLSSEASSPYMTPKRTVSPDSPPLLDRS
jgi:hypothetical protein